MDRFGAGVTMSGINTANLAYFLLLGGATRRLRIRQIMVNIGVAPTTAPAFALVRTTVRGTQASTLAGLPLDTGVPAGIGTLDVCASATQPTFTVGNQIARGGLAITAGGVYVWSFWDVPLIVPATAAAGLAVVNVNASGATTGTFSCSMLWDE